MPTSSPWANSVPLPLERIYRNERAWGSQPLFTQPGPDGLLEWSWKSAVEEARRVAAYLQSLDLAPRSNIAILSKNCAWWIMADFAIWMAGHVSVPVYPSLSESAVAAILHHSQPAACFLGEAEHPPKLSHLSCIAFPTASQGAVSDSAVDWKDAIGKFSPIAGDPVRDPTEAATLIYTSGTMGDPKGVLQTFQSLAWMAESMKPALAGARGVDRILSYLPLAHIAERAIVEANCIYQPIHIFFTAGQATFLEDLKRARPTIFFTVPRLLARFEQGVHERISERVLSCMLPIPLLGARIRKRVLSGLGLDRTRLAASGSAPLPLETLYWYRRMGLNLIEGYGMTETGITHVPLPGKFRPGYVGNASPCAETRLSLEGEIQIKGPMNFTGYYRNPELTRSCFTGDGFFQTGDRGEMDTEGRLRIIGRLKEEFKTGKGKYVIPAPIESALARSGLFEAVCVMGEGLAGPFAAVVLTAERRADAASQERWPAMERMLESEIDRVNQALERHERLRFLVVISKPWSIENDFLTPALKVRRARIERAYAERFQQWEAAGARILRLEE